MIKKIAIVLLAVLVCLGCCACSGMKTVDEQSVKQPLMFSIVESYQCGQVIVDNETGVMYWESSGTYNKGTITLLVDKEGNPKIFKGR